MGTGRIYTYTCTIEKIVCLVIEFVKSAFILLFAPGVNGNPASYSKCNQKRALRLLISFNYHINSDNLLHIFIIFLVLSNL